MIFLQIIQDPYNKFTKTNGHKKHTFFKLKYFGKGSLTIKAWSQYVSIKTISSRFIMG